MFDARSSSLLLLCSLRDLPLRRRRRRIHGRRLVLPLRCRSRWTGRRRRRRLLLLLFHRLLLLALVQLRSDPSTQQWMGGRTAGSDPVLVRFAFCWMRERAMSQGQWRPLPCALVASSLLVSSPVFFSPCLWIDGFVNQTQYREHDWTGTSMSHSREEKRARSAR